MLKDFRDFIMRGNVLDLAIAVVIGGAFGKIITSLVNDILMPPIGLLLQKVDFGSLYLNLSETPYATLADAQAAGAPTLNYGAFINTVVDFLIITIVIFLIIRALKRFQLAKVLGPESSPKTKKCPFCLSVIPGKAKKCAYCTSRLK